MPPSRKTTAAASAAPIAWHAIEVRVPDRSRLAPCAQGIPGRTPPTPNTLIASIAAALDELHREPGAPVAGQASPGIWLVAPSRRVGNAWLETLARLGHRPVNVRVTTLSALAFDLVADDLARHNTRLAPPRAKLVAVERALAESQNELRSFIDTSVPLHRLADRILASLESLRLADITAEDVTRGLRRSDKAHDLGLLLDRYDATLQSMRLVDQASQLKLAIKRVMEGTVPPDIRRLLVPDDLDLPKLQRRLLDALSSAPGVLVRRLPTDPPAHDEAPPSPCTIFRASGEANEVRHVLRTCLARGLRLDEIEVVHTDDSTYPSLIREIVAALPSPPSSVDGPGHLPVTFAEGLPLADSKPGRALADWLAWRREGHPQLGLERMLRDGVLDLSELVSDPPQASSLIRELRGVIIGRGLERTTAMLGAAAARTAGLPPEAFARRRDDDDGAMPADLLTDEQLADRKARISQRLSCLATLATTLSECEGGPHPTAEDVLTGARRFIDLLAARDSEFDGNARRKLLDELDAMLHWGGTSTTATADDMLDWLEQLPAELVVLGAGPRPGCLHVCGLPAGGHSGRPYTFVLGLDENRFPGGGVTDPVLTDGDRGMINATTPDAPLSVARDAAARALDLWHRLLARVRGEVWVGFTCRDTGDDSEVFPSPALVALHARATGRPFATTDDLLAALPPPETLVPTDASLALDESQWWLATLGPLATASDVRAALGAHRDHLTHGQVAVAARASDAFTPHDGHVPAAGEDLDPRVADGRAASPHSLETIGACPRRFFFRYGLEIEPLSPADDDTGEWLTPLDAGSLMHTVLERFMRGLIDRGELPHVEQHLEELYEILDEELEASSQRHPPLTALAFDARREELRLTMHTFLHDEERSCRETGRRPMALEAAIGLEPSAEGTPFDCRQPVSVELTDGKTIRLRGRIDRIDVRDAEGSPSYTLWDYKSGSGYGFPSMAEDDPFQGGRRLQHGLYVVMLRARLQSADGELAGGDVERFGYFFPTRAGKGRRLEWTTAQLDQCTTLVRQLADITRHGAFLPTDSTADCGFCDFATICGDPRTVAREAARKLAASADLQNLFATLRRQPSPRRLLERRLPHDAPFDLTPHPAVPALPPDEHVRQRIRADLGTTFLVEAAAGTGKTTCMVDRMLALVRTGTAAPEGIVAVTFTKKAASELRRRFREKLQRLAVETTDPIERDRFTAARDRVDSMVIGTIHSFAGRLLRERPLEAGIDPGFRELDETADRLLRRQAWRAFVTMAPTDHPHLLADLQSVGLRLGDLSDLFIDRFATYGDVESWPVSATPAPDIAALLGPIEAFVTAIEAETFSPPADRGSDPLMNALEQFARLARRCDTSSIVAVMDLVKELDRSPKAVQSYWQGTEGTPAEPALSGKERARHWNDAWTRLRDSVALPALWQWRAHRYPAAIAALRAALATYDRLRASRGVLSFQDLLGTSAKLLATHPEVRRSFRARYTHILVDEFQDTDPIQAEMLLLLTATDPTQTNWRHCQPVPGSLFVVGDPKQSLYRFRRADIVTYNTVRNTIEQHGTVLALTTNFRSRHDLVTWTNDVFGDQFPPSTTAESPSFTPSTSGRREAPPSGQERQWLTGVRALRFVRNGSAGDHWAEAEGHAIASFIRHAIDTGMAVPRTPDEIAKGITTACRPGDFMLVARERKHLGLYAAALHAAGLPVDVTGTLGTDQAEPLRDLRTCLAAVADPDDPVAILALLRGAVFGFSDADLYEYHAAGGRFTGVIDVPASLPEPLRARLTGARNAFARWRTWLRNLPIAATVERIVDDAGLFLLASLANGEAGPRGRAVAGLILKFLEQLRSDRMDVVSVHDCLDLLDDMVGDEARAEFDPLTIDVPSNDRIRIMNLHKAKGLEAPVVFLVDYQKRRVSDDVESGPFLRINRLHDQTVGYLAVTTSAGWSSSIIAAADDWETHARAERAFEAAEQIRLDYVAATRPGTCLVVSLFERHHPATKSRPESFVGEGAWERFVGGLASVPDLPTAASGSPAASAPVAAPHPASPAGRLSSRVASIHEPTFARISPRDLLTEPAEAIRFTGDGLGEAWGRAIHRILELASRGAAFDVAAAAATALSGEEISEAHLDRAITTVRDVLASDLWARALASGARFVEVPFSLQVRGEDLPVSVRSVTAAEQPLPTVIRGVIDLVFADPVDGSWTVVDWKTDSVASGSEAMLDAHYRPQVELYAECWRLVAPQDPSPGPSSTPAPSPKSSP